MNRTMMVSILSIVTMTASVSFASQMKSYHFRLPASHTVMHAIPANKNITDLSELLHNKYLFALRDPGTGNISYTRSGKFILMDGFFYQQGKRLQGYTISTDLVTNACQLSDIQFSTMAPPQATAQIDTRLNLNSNSEVPSQPFDQNDRNSFNYETNSIIYDSLGKQHASTLFFVKNTTTSNDWSIHVVIDGSILTKGRLSFKSSGEFDQTDGLSNIVFNPTGGAATQLLSYSLAGSTQYGVPDQLISINHDGRGAGYLSSIDVDDIGYVNLEYTNGEAVTAGKIAVLPHSN